MPISASGWLSNSLVAVGNTLANSAGFRALMAAADVSAALALIYYQDYRGGISAPLTILRLGPGQLLTTATRTPAHVDAVNCELIWTELTSGATTQKDLALLQLNYCGAMINEIHALINTGTTYPAKAEISYEPPERVGDDDAFAGCWSGTITFTWEI